MRFTSSICRVFLFVSFVLTEEQYNLFHYGATLIDDQLYFFEMMLDTYEKFDFSPDIRSLIENKEKYPVEQAKKRISLHVRCVRKARDGMLHCVRKNNAHVGNVFHFLFSGDSKGQYKPELAESLKREYMQIAIEMKQVFFHEMPTYYNELGKNMSIDFTEEEIKRSEKIIRDNQEESKQDLLQMSQQLGVTEKL